MTRLLARVRQLSVVVLATLGAACSAHSGHRQGDANSQDTRIGFWNVRKLGEDVHKDPELLCALIRAHFDVLAMAEVMADDEMGDIASLSACLDAEFSALRTPDARPRGTSPHREHTMLWLRRERAAACAGWDALRYAAPPAQWAVDHGGDPFLRPPSFACVRVADGRELLVGVFHARWGSGEPVEVAREIVWLDDVLAEAPRAFTGSSNVLLLGDLNLGPEAVSRATGLRVHTLGTGSTLTPSGEPTTHLYDQLLVGPETALPLADARVLDVRDEAGGPGEYHRVVSDHLPIITLLAPTRPMTAERAMGVATAYRAHGRDATPMPYRAPAGVKP